MNYLGKTVKVLFCPDNFLDKEKKYLVIADETEMGVVILYHEGISGHNAGGNDDRVFLKGYQDIEKRGSNCWCIETEYIEIYNDFKTVFNELGDSNDGA